MWPQLTLRSHFAAYRPVHMSAQEGTSKGGCHQSSRVTRGVWGREVTATTLSALGASFLPTPSSAAVGKEARTAPVMQPRQEEKQREQPSWGGSHSARPWGGTAAPTRSPDEGGGCEHSTLCVLKPQRNCRDQSCSHQTASHKAPEAGGGLGHQKMRSAFSILTPQNPSHWWELAAPL